MERLAMVDRCSDMRDMRDDFVLARPQKSPLRRMAMLCLGWFVIAVSPIIGAIPGPGGIFVFAAGLVLVLRNSNWAKRQFIRACNRWPKLGTYADKALRRQRDWRCRRRRDDGRDRARDGGSVDLKLRGR
jgi:hypothetical protein